MINPDNREPGQETEQEKIEREVREAREEFSRPVPEEYKKIIRQGPRIGFPDESFVLEHIDEEKAVPFLKKYIENRDVIDCGCGDLAGSRAIAEIAEIDGAKRYTGIDFQYPPFSKYVDQRTLAEAERQHGAKAFNLPEANGLVAPGRFGEMPVAVVQGEMLMTLAKMKDGESPKFFVFAGVQGGVKEYFECLVAELNRLCQKGDAVLEIGMNKDLGKILEERNFKREFAKGCDSFLFIKQ